MLRPALVLGEDRNLVADVGDVAEAGMLRPALVLGEDRNSGTVAGQIPVPAGCARPWCWARIATGAMATIRRAADAGCARPWCWARIATQNAMAHRPSWRGCARPWCWARIATLVMAAEAVHARLALRPALVLGEDRNDPATRDLHPSVDAAPGLGAGRGSQPVTTMRVSHALGSCARPWCWARIATTSAATNVRSRPSCARPWCWARIATPRGTAPAAQAWQLRPALVLGEDRNTGCSSVATPLPTAAPGLGAGRGSQRHRQHLARPGHPRCARPWCWARIATSHRCRP